MNVSLLFFVETLQFNVLAYGTIEDLSLFDTDFNYTRSFVMRREHHLRVIKCHAISYL